MIRKFHGIDPEMLEDLLDRVLDDADDLPDADELDEDVRWQIVEGLTEDDFALDLLTLRETAYERAEQVPDDVDPHGEGAQVLENEVFRAAEWLDSSLRLFVRSQVEAERRHRDGELSREVSDDA